MPPSPTTPEITKTMKKTLFASLLALGLFGSSCLGPDPLYNSLKNWNAEVSEQDFLNEAIFLGLTIFPVYSFALFGDIVIFNTVQYWSGEPLISEPGPFPGFSSKD
jgi:hypothetical protein